MSNDSALESPAADAHVVRSVSATESTPAGESMPVAATPVDPAWRGIKPGTWIVAVAAAVVLAVVLSGVSFGTGVFVGRHAGRFGDRGVAGATALNGYGQPQALPGYAQPGPQDGRRMMPGQQVAPQGVPGQGRRGGRGPGGSEIGTATPSPFGD